MHLHKYSLRVIHVVLLVVMLACKDEVSRKLHYTPPLSKHQLALILTEKSLIEASLKDRPEFDSVQFKTSFRASALESTIRYYAERPQEFKDVYLEVLAMLQKKQFKSVK